jgi:Na+/proline symporter
MNGLDWAVLIGYFGVMVAIGIWSHKRVDDVSDFFTAGGKMPWWLSGISHHMSGYSAVMFTGYAGIAYTYGVTSFITWSFPSPSASRSARSCSRRASTGCAHGSMWRPRWST